MIFKLRNQPIQLIYRLTSLLTWPHNGIVLENTQFEFPRFSINVPCIFWVLFLSVPSICQSACPFWATAFFQIVLENTQFEFMQQNVLTLPFCLEFPPRFQRCYRKLNPTLLYWTTGFFLQMVLENTQFEFMQQNILTLSFCLEFPSSSRNDIANSI